MLLACDLKSLHRLAAAEVARLVRALTAGLTPAQLDLPHRPGGLADLRPTIVAALDDPQAAIPVELLRQAGGHDRAWGEALLAARLSSAWCDERAPGALAELAAGWAIPALEESLEDLASDHPFAVAVAAALARLRR